MRSTGLSIGGVALVLVVSGAAHGQTSGETENRSSRVDTEELRKYRDAGTSYEKARLRFQAQDFAGTREHLNHAFKLVPEHAESRLLLAQILYAEKDYPAALAEVVRAKAGYAAVGALRERVQQDRLSQSRAATRGTGQPSAGLDNGASGRVSGIDRERRNELEGAPTRIATGGVPAPYSFLHGNVLLRLGRADEAVEQYQEALRTKPDYGEAANNLASVYLQKGMADKALEVITTGEAGGLKFSPALKKAVEESAAKRK